MDTDAADRSVALPICIIGPEPDASCVKSLFKHDHRFVVLPTLTIGPDDLTPITVESNEIRDAVGHAVFVEPIAEVIGEDDEPDIIQFLIVNCTALFPPPNKIVGTD